MSELVATDALTAVRLSERTPTPRLPPDVSRPSFPSHFFETSSLSPSAVYALSSSFPVCWPTIEMCSSSSSVVHTLLVVSGVREHVLAQSSSSPSTPGPTIYREHWSKDHETEYIKTTASKTSSCRAQGAGAWDRERARLESSRNSYGMKGQRSPSRSTTPSHECSSPKTALHVVVDLCRRRARVGVFSIVYSAHRVRSRARSLGCVSAIGGSVLGAVRLNEVLGPSSSVASCGRRSAFLRFARDRIWISSQPRRDLPSRWFLKLGLCAAPIGRCILGALRLKDVLVAGSSVASCGRCSAFSRVASDRIRISSQPCRLFQKRRCWHAEC
ncbi:hypothetical protein DFP72DRAFT_1062610 [Ephemerocybe angulata]|uniref:Uncharacterized protein n=1 Tax=Ephemerocybe angulata TaxID=980116 RepID=A0A8H6IB07_9AGAR|nr:hypothetical protein DFP72DRAFT_1062607 [Tulosesus angulatus]KAF6760868.1 hypothetical protein DFP72DRAFT_1062610 [Tulosesus angulatus]